MSSHVQLLMTKVPFTFTFFLLFVVEERQKLKEICLLIVIKKSRSYIFGNPQSLWVTKDIGIKNLTVGKACSSEKSELPVMSAKIS